MKASPKYLLLLDPKQEVLTLQEAALSCFYSGEVVSFTEPSRALEIFQSKGSPEMIIIDSNIIPDFSTGNLTMPIIATSFAPINEQLLTKYPSVTAVIEKPLSAHSFTYLIKSLTNLPIKTPSHIPVSIDLLLRLGIGSFDLYLKLSETNFVKILHKGEHFFENDAKRLAEKGIQELFIKMDDSNALMHILEKDMSSELVQSSDFNLVLENIEAFERVAKFMKWSPAVLVSAEKSVTQAVKILSKNQNVMNVLKRRLKQSSSPYARHIGLLTYLCCAVGSSIGWIGESGQVKLALAALIHDVAVDDECYLEIKNWDRRAADPADKTPETLKYRMHPFEASKIVNSLDTISSDVDQIILQHHEMKDGSGFPRSMDSSRIGQLPALFIIVEDLVEFIDNGDNIETSITDFIMWGREYYDAGHFKKLFAAFEEKLKV